MSDIELKPCPFCGGEPTAASKADFSRIFEIIACKCGASISDANAKGNHKERWNTRTPPKAEPTDGAPETIWAWTKQTSVRDGNSTTRGEERKWSESLLTGVVGALGAEQYTRTELHQAALAERDAEIAHHEQRFKETAELQDAALFKRDARIAGLTTALHGFQHAVGIGLVNVRPSDREAFQVIYERAMKEINDE